MNSSLILPQSNLPLVDGLKPRSRALSKKPNSRNNNVRLISYSSAYNKEIFLNDKWSCIEMQFNSKIQLQNDI